MKTHPELGYFDEGLELTDPSLYAAALLPFGKAQALLPTAYRSKIFADLEDEKVWTRTWVCIGTEGEIAEPGDVLPYTVGNHGIHVQRESDGTLIGRFNMAQHGGCRAVPLQCQTGVKTKCSFTSCGYSRDRGPIRADELGENTPTMRQFLGYRPDRLFPVKVETRGPFIFVNLDQDTAPLKAQFTGEAAKLLRGATKSIVDAGGFWTESKSNWKFSAKTLMSTLMRAFDLKDGEPASDEDLPYVALSTDSAGKRASKTFGLWLFPNLIMVATPNQLVSVVLQPTGMDETSYRVRCFSRGAMDIASAEFETQWRALLKSSGEEAEAFQHEAASWSMPKRPSKARLKLPHEDQPWNHRFHGFLVDHLLAEHEYVWANPLFHQPGR